MSVRNRLDQPELPFYNQALGAAEETYVIPPPASFPGVTARVFPLQASINILRAFCKNYLNVAPGYEFTPAFPGVILVVLDYGRMAIEQANMGWISQHEVYFGVPLAMWRRDRLGRRRFDRWVLNTPFIVVDNPSSLTTGREVYGWPKVLAELKYNPERWLSDPRNPLRLLTLDVKGINSEFPAVPLLDIEQQLGQNPSLAPPSLGLIDPFEWFSRLLRTAWSIGFDLTQVLLGAPLAGYDAGLVRDRGEVLSDSLGRLAGFYQNPRLDVVTLKQFRDAGDPSQICYQSLVASQLGITHYNCGGLLGLDNVLRGDVTGGFRLHLFDNPAFPIVESLGLKVQQERTIGGRTCAVLQPLFPFWMSVDLAYGRGETLCWRMRGEPWYRKTARVSPRPAPASRMPYDTFAGAGEQEWSGPFLVPEARLDVYPLRAERAKLHRFIRKFLSLGGPRRRAGAGLPTFQAVGEHVYLFVSGSRMFSAARSAAWLEAALISFRVPVLARWPDGRQELVVVTPFAFVDNPTLAMTLREVQGLPAMDATVLTPPRFWRPKAPLLVLQLDMLAALDAGLGFQRRTLLEILPGSAPGTGGMTGLAHRPVALKTLMLKQFRDAEQPSRACYQALVREPWIFSDLKAILPLENETTLRIYRYPSLPVVETLGLRSAGLEVPPVQDVLGTVADLLTPESPFRIESTIDIEIGEVLFQAADRLPWKPAPPHRVRHYKAGRPRRRAVGEVEELLDLYRRLCPDADLQRDGLQPLLRSLFPGEARRAQAAAAARSGQA